MEFLFKKDKDSLLKNDGFINKNLLMIILDFIPTFEEYMQPIEHDLGTLFNTGFLSHGYSIHEIKKINECDICKSSNIMDTFRTFMIYTKQKLVVCLNESLYHSLQCKDELELWTLFNLLNNSIKIKTTVTITIGDNDPKIVIYDVNYMCKVSDIINMLINDKIIQEQTQLIQLIKDGTICNLDDFIANQTYDDEPYCLVVYI